MKSPRRMRRWTGLHATRRLTAAREQFDRALTLDANSAAALEGFGCLLVDAGRSAAARPLIEHAVQLQPRNVGALECLAYLDAGAGKPSRGDQPPSQVARVQALAAILAGDVEPDGGRCAGRRATRTFANGPSRCCRPRRSAPAYRMLCNRSRARRATAASTPRLKLCGTALRRAEFVFNRMARLQRDHRAGAADAVDAADGVSAAPRASSRRAARRPAGVLAGIWAAGHVKGGAENLRLQDARRARPRPSASPEPLCIRQAKA